MTDISIKDLEFITSKTNYSQGGICGDIDPQISFYRNPKTNEIYFCGNRGFENYFTLELYKGNLKPKEIKDLSDKLNYQQFCELRHPFVD